MAVNPATYNVNHFKGTANINADFVRSFSIVQNLSGSIVTFTLTPPKAMTEILLLASGQSPTDNGSKTEILTTGSTSTFKVTINDADIENIAAGEYRLAVWITDSLGVTEPYIIGKFNLRNV